MLLSSSTFDNIIHRGFMCWQSLCGVVLHTVLIKKESDWILTSVMAGWVIMLQVERGYICKTLSQEDELLVYRTWNLGHKQLILSMVQYKMYCKCAINRVNIFSKWLKTHNFLSNLKFFFNHGLFVIFLFYKLTDSKFTLKLGNTTLNTELYEISLSVL